MLARLILPKPALLQLFQQLLQLIAQRLLILPQFAELILIALLLALLTLLAVLAALAALAALILALPEGAVAQLLLLADHVAEFVERRHHVVVAVVHVAARPRHLQVFQHLLQLIEQLPRGVLGAGARQLLEPVEHALEVLRAQHARIGIDAARLLLRILAHLLGQRLQELVERGAQFVGQLLDLFVAGAAFERLTQRLLRRAQLRFGVGDVAVLDLRRHRPQPLHDFAQMIVGLGLRQSSSRSSAGRDRRRLPSRTFPARW